MASYDTTCPFVVRVWKKGAQIGGKGYTVVVHGKWNHEETRATFSRAAATAPVVVVRDLEETEALAAVIDGRRDAGYFWDRFRGRTSDGFDPARDLERVGVVNQTTMLATETAAIAERVRVAIEARDGTDDGVRRHQRHAVLRDQGEPGRDRGPDRRPAPTSRSSSVATTRPTRRTWSSCARTPACRRTSSRTPTSW